MQITVTLPNQLTSLKGGSTFNRLFYRQRNKRFRGLLSETLQPGRVLLEPPPHPPPPSELRRPLGSVNTCELWMVGFPQTTSQVLFYAGTDVLFCDPRLSKSLGSGCTRRLRSASPEPSAQALITLGQQFLLASTFPITSPKGGLPDSSALCVLPPGTSRLQ